MRWRPGKRGGIDEEGGGKEMEENEHKEEADEARWCW